MGARSGGWKKEGRSVGGAGQGPRRSGGQTVISGESEEAVAGALKGKTLPVEINFQKVSHWACRN